MQQPASWLRHAPICFALMSKSPPNFSWPDFYFQVFENICQSLRNTHGNLGINAGFSLVKNAAGVLETARNPCYVPTDAAAKPCCFIHLLGCFFCQIISMLKLNFYFVQRCGRQSLWPSFMEFEWQNSHSVGTELTEHGRLLLSWSPSLSGRLSVTADLYLLNPHVLFYS